MHEPYVETILKIQSISSIAQFIGDILVEILALTGPLPKVEFRFAYTFIAFLAAFTSFKTYDSIRKDRFGLVHEDIQITLICELALITSDFWFVYGLGNTHYIWYRFPFIFLTAINLIIIVHIMMKYSLWTILYAGSAFSDPMPNEIEQRQRSVQEQQVQQVQQQEEGIVFVHVSAL